MAPISQCADPTFAQGLLGPGVVIQPEGSILFAPADGRVEFILSTKHALGMETPEGVKFLIHVGLDTNRLEGQGFQLFVQVGSQVRRGTSSSLLTPRSWRNRAAPWPRPLCFAAIGRLGYGAAADRPRARRGRPGAHEPPCLKLSIPYAALDRKPAASGLSIFLSLRWRRGKVKGRLAFSTEELYNPNCTAGLAPTGRRDVRYLQ